MPKVGVKLNTTNVLLKLGAFAPRCTKSTCDSRVKTSLCGGKYYEHNDLYSTQGNLGLAGNAQTGHKHFFRKETQQAGSTMNDNSFDGVKWQDAQALGLRGIGWRTEHREQPFDRFPSFLRTKISPRLWELSTWPAGVHVDLRCAAKNLFVRWTLDMKADRSIEAYQAACARSGLDGYGRNADGAWRWIGSQECWKEPVCDGRLNRLVLDGADREYRIYLPLMRRVLKMEIGAREPIRPGGPKDDQPIAYYGTSIVHGAVVSRPGMTHAAQLSRALNRDVLNLGVCGRAWCETDLAHALGQLAPALYLVDVLPNNDVEQILQRLPPFLQILRQARPNIPILLLGDRAFGDDAYIPERKQLFLAKNTALKDTVDDLQRGGMTGLHLAFHPSWFGEDGEGSTDGSHPNDLGATRMAAALAPVVARILHLPPPARSDPGNRTPQRQRQKDDGQQHL